MSVTFLSNQSSFDLSSINTTLVAFFTCEVDSELFIAQNSYLETNKEILKTLNISVYFVARNPQVTTSAEFLLDTENTLASSSPKIQDKKNPGQNLILYRLEDSKLVHLDTKENPGSQENWIGALVDLGKNYTQKEADSDGYYKWGQLVPETAEYLCKDCGYIEEFTVGSIFPICEVCLAGEPSGPSTSAEGYWEKI